LETRHLRRSHGCRRWGGLRWLRGVDLNHANTFISPLLPVSSFIYSQSHCVRSARSRTILGQGQDTVYLGNARQVRLVVASNAVPVPS
jgi:hypothetical protein